MLSRVEDSIMSISQKTALVTGASRGLGRALALQLATEGARVVAVARSRAPLDELVKTIERRGGEAIGLRADLGDKNAILPLVGAASATFGPIDILVHNASELGPTPLRVLLDTECEDLERVLAVNLVGPFRLSKAVAGNMALRGHGVIVHVSSDASVETYPTWGAYSVSKAALDHLARIWGAELAERGVRVLSVDPGEMDTDMHRAAVPDTDPATLARPDDVARRIIELIAQADSFEPGARVAVSNLGDAA